MVLNLSVFLKINRMLYVQIHYGTMVNVFWQNATTRVFY